MRLERLVTIELTDDDLAPEDWCALAALAREVVRARLDHPELTAILAGADALLVGLGVEVSAAMLEAAPRLRYVGVFGTSVATIDPSAQVRGVTVRNVPGYATESVAELAIGIVLDRLRGLTDARVRAAEGDLSEARLLGRELRGLRVGVLGLGAIGARLVAILSHGFGADVRAWSRTPRDGGSVSAPMEEVLDHAEVLFVCLALTPETRGLLDDARLGHLPHGALVVHLCPAAIVSIDALVPRVASRTLSFATDHGDELAPDALVALRALPGCTLYPPIGYATREASAARRARLLTDLARFAEGDGPP